MKALGIIALIALIAIPSSSFAWGPPRGGRAVRPFFPGVVAGRNFGHVPFGFFRNRAVIASPFFLSPGWYSPYYGPRYWYPSYGYVPPYPYYGYMPYAYNPLPPAPPNDTAYDRGYAEGYARGYEEAQKELNRKLELEKTPGDEHEQSGGQSNQ